MSRTPKFRKIGPNTYAVSFEGFGVVGVVQRTPLSTGWSAFDANGQKLVADYPGSRKTAGRLILALQPDLQSRHARQE